MLAHQLRSQCPLSFSPSGTLGSQELRLRRGCVCVCVAVWLCVCVCVCVCVSQGLPTVTIAFVCLSFRNMVEIQTAQESVT